MINESLVAIDELQRMPAPCLSPQALAFDGTDLWVGCSDTARLYGLRANTGAVFEETSAPGFPIGMVVTGDSIRVVSSENGDDDNRVIRRYVMGHGFKSESMPCPDDTGSFLAYDGDALFLSQRHEKKILELDAAGGVVRTIDVPRGIVGMVIIDGRFYLATAAGRDMPADYRLMRLDARGATPIFTELAAFAFNPRSLAWDGTKFWTNDREKPAIVAFAAIGVL